MFHIFFLPLIWWFISFVGFYHFVHSTFFLSNLKHFISLMLLFSSFFWAVHHIVSPIPNSEFLIFKNSRINLITYQEILKFLELGISWNHVVNRSFAIFFQHSCIFYWVFVWRWICWAQNRKYEIGVVQFQKAQCRVQFQNEIISLLIQRNHH